MLSVPVVPAHVTPLRLVQPAAVDLARATPLLSDEASEWLGGQTEGPRPQFRRFLTDLSFPVREHSPSLVFKKAAFIDLGAVQAGTDSLDVEIEWRSASLAPLFPVFAGHLTIFPTELRLEGFYAPPAGELGVVLDRAFLNIAARGTARWFLSKAADALGRPFGSRSGPV